MLFILSCKLFISSRAPEILLTTANLLITEDDLFDNNVVEIDITGSGDAYVEDIDLNKNKLIIKGKSVYGQTVKEIDLPCAIDGELESCRYEEGAKKIRTSWSKVKGDGDEPWGGIVWSQDYTVVTDSRGNIISISR